ncbi:uncharacterized protein LOC126734326 isoform X2 [Anthonomus grandis grandis]|uniref:uncharacterized protein LOC126734326 isoform X2 n=1 Tax=Anthonomus grandis grandis TaxID=2921223 RepID=UPI002165A7F8|nr:uncharacterized protein LOC126734326 isoform X2 [Anthonomus grandis grandis]
MTSLTSDPSKMDHHYQSSDTSDHGLLSHHTCTCCRECLETPETPKTEHPRHPLPSPHHHVVNLSHTPLQMTHHVHLNHHNHHHGAAVPPATASPKPQVKNCTCHLKTENEAEERQNIEPNAQGRKLDEDRIEVSPLPPALPPRPPPRPRYEGTGSLNSRYRPRIASPHTGGVRKYVFWCCACGGLATILGALFLAVYFLLRTYTSTLGYFETIPTFVPATMLILTGLCIISLARRKNRYSYLIKVCGLCCLVCALTCVLVTITTTVIHMNRLQTLRECVYTQKTRTCTCYSILLEAQSSTDDNMRYVFDSTPDCEVIHGALYSCLRVMFGLSVSGILVCIFSCMLVYQLLSHEKKKMYWEQLELRCRSFYQQHPAPPSSTPGSLRGPPVPSTTYCSCCEECRYSTAAPQPPQVYPWDTHHVAERFWTPGRVGNFYSPNPEDVPSVNVETNRGRPGWSWRRLPWSRTTAEPAEIPRENSLTYQGAASSADSQYGFSNRSGDNALQSDQTSGSNGSYSMLDNRPPIGGVYVWGPPPPYSDPNSPARRFMAHQSPQRYHHAHHHAHTHESHCQMNEGGQFRASRRARPQSNKDNYENTTEPEIHQTNEVNSESTDTSSCVERVSHTLPVRKVKKRSNNEMASVKSTSNQQNHPRTNVQSVFGQQEEQVENEYHEPTVPETAATQQESQQCRFLPRLQGVENAAFQKQEPGTPKPETTESEVYFADVSSCCNISVRNDGQDSSLYDEALEGNNGRLISLQKPVEVDKKEATSQEIKEEDDYLAQKMGNRQSIRSRMPFPMPSSEDLAEFSSDPCIQLLPKDISQNSLCSSVQTPMTETTDDTLSPEECCSKNNYFQEESIHRPFNTNQFLAPDAQYEVIPEDDKFRNSSNLTNTISGVNFDQGNYFNKNYNASPKNVPPKTLNLNQQGSRRNMGTNISALIQNLGGNPAGLLYGDKTEEEEVQGLGCHSDGTMDSGWQSGSEKQEGRNGGPEGEGGGRPVNV